MAELMKALYPLVVVISIIGYLPQIQKLMFATRRAQNVSLSSWALWLVSGTLSLGYGVYVLEDLMFILTSALGALFIYITFGLIVYNNYIRFEEPGHLRAKFRLLFGLDKRIKTSVTPARQVLPLKTKA